VPTSSTEAAAVERRALCTGFRFHLKFFPPSLWQIYRPTSKGVKAYTADCSVEKCYAWRRVAESVEHIYGLGCRWRVYNRHGVFDTNRLRPIIYTPLLAK